MDRKVRARIFTGARIGAAHTVRLLLRMAGTIAGAGLFVFLLLDVSIPGGFRSVVLSSGDTRSPRARALIDEYHLDDNVLLRYLYWLGDAFRGDFGRSVLSDESVTDIILHRLPISIEIMLVAVTLSVGFGVPLGLAAVARAHRRDGRVLRALLGVSQSLPVYVTPMFLTAFFSVRLGWLPASGWTRISASVFGNIERLILPMAALVLTEAAVVARIVRSDVQRIMDSDFIAAATGKGLSQRYVLFRHALRPASLGLLNVIGLNIGALLTGALVIEVIFGIGGLGQVLLASAMARDLPLILGVTTYVVIVHVALSTLVDVLMLLLDPRIRRP